MSKGNGKYKAERDRGKYPPKHIRPTALDLAALEVLSKKMGGLPEADVWRISLHHYVEFSGVRDQVEKRAHLLSSVGA